MIENILEFITNNIFIVIICVLVVAIVIAIIARPKKKEPEVTVRKVYHNEPFFLNPDKPLVKHAPEPEYEPEPVRLSPEEEAKATWAIPEANEIQEEEKPEVTENTFGGQFDDFKEIPK